MNDIAYTADLATRPQSPPALPEAMRTCIATKNTFVCRVLAPRDGTCFQRLRAAPQSLARHTFQTIRTLSDCAVIRHTAAGSAVTVVGRPARAIKGTLPVIGIQGGAKFNSVSINRSGTVGFLQGAVHLFDATLIPP